MIVEVGGGKGGLKEYLEHGKKRGRELHRDQLDQRVPLAGDLTVFEMATQIHGSDGHHYDHITLSFSESHVSDEMLQLAVAEFRDHALAAWPERERHRIAFYAEAHRPRMLSYIHSETGELVERLTHIHIGLGKHDLLTGASIEPLGFLGPQSDNLKYIDAWQESFNARHGFTSPKDNPKITPENAVDVLSRYTGQRPDHLGTFNEKKAALEVTLQKEIIARSITTWETFSQLLATHGSVSKMRVGKFGECYRIKPHGAARAMRLQGVFFQRQFIERPTAEKIAIVSERARAAYLEQMGPRKAPQYVARMLSDWHQFKARENRYLHTGSKFYREVYKPADAATRHHLLNKIQKEHDGIQGSAATQTRKIATARNRLPHLPVRDLDGIQARTEMLLRDHSSLDVSAVPAAEPDGVGVRQTAGPGRPDGEVDSFTQSDTGTGASGSVDSDRDCAPAGNVGQIHRLIQASSVLTRVHADRRERYEQATDKERYADIRQHLDCAQLLGSLSHTHGLNPELYQLTKAKDGIPRIQCGSRALSPSDFLTKELGLPWRDAAQILRKTFEHQMGGKVTMARGRAAMPSLWREMKSEQLAGKAVAMQRLQAFDAETKANRAALFAALKTEQSKALAGSIGTRRKAAQSLDKLRAATAKAEFSESRRALRQSLQPSQANAWRSFLQLRAQTGSEEALAALRKLDDTARAVPAQSITGTLYLDDEEDEKKRRRRARESSASILKMLTHSVEINGDITYSQHGRAVLRDEGRYLAVLDEHSEEAIAAALLFAREKFGANLTLTGSAEFQRRVVEVAVAQGIAVKFVDPLLEATRQRILDETSHAVGTKVVYVLAPALTLSNPPEQRDMGGHVALAPVVNVLPPVPHPVEIPVNDVPSPEASARSPEENDELVWLAETEVAKAKLTVGLKSQGREVRTVEDGVEYFGKMDITVDGRFAVQSLGRAAVVIHDLAQLDGQFTDGEEAHITYFDSRGQDKQKDRQTNQPGLGR
jgi:Large polyvalent protein-associated domain 7